MTPFMRLTPDVLLLTQVLSARRQLVTFRLCRSVLLVGFLVCHPVMADDPTYSFHKPIETGRLTQDELLSIQLDEEVFAGTRVGFPDLRLLDTEGSAVPYLLRRVQTTVARSRRVTSSARRLTARRVGDNGLELVVQPGSSVRRPRGMRIVTPLQDFSQRVSVSTSADGVTWVPAVEDAVIFDYSKHVDVRNDTVKFPAEIEHRHFRITIDDVTAEQESQLLTLTRRLRGREETGREEQLRISRRPFRIERIEFWQDVRDERIAGNKQQEYAAIEYNVEHDSEKRQTIVRVDSQGQPLTSLDIDTPDRNFSRQAVIEVSDVGGGWTQIGRQTLAHLEFRDFKQQNLRISFPESRGPQYRLVIENGESRPLQIAGVTGTGNVYETVFLGTPEEEYRLVYGSDDAPPPDSDTAAVKTLLRKGFDPVQVDLGAEIGSPVPPQAGIRWSERLNDPNLLIGIIVILLVVLAYGLYQATKRVNSLPGNDEPLEH